MTEDEGLMAQATLEGEDNQQPEQETISHLEADNQPSVDETTIASEGEEIEFKREEWFPEKFWNEEKGPDIENLAKGYAELQKKFSQGKHKTPENYDISLFEKNGIPQDDELMQTFVNWSKENGVTQGAFDELAQHRPRLEGFAENSRVLRRPDRAGCCWPAGRRTFQGRAWRNGRRPTLHQ